MTTAATAIELEATPSMPAPLNPWLPRTPSQRREEEDIALMLEEQEEAELELLVAEYAGKGHRAVRRSFLAAKAASRETRH